MQLLVHSLRLLEHGRLAPLPSGLERGHRALLEALEQLREGDEVDVDEVNQHRGALEQLGEGRLQRDRIN